MVPFQEVWGRSYCRALERLVDIVSEYPGEVEHMFSPSCVSLLRCTGCCGDENLHCVPVETVNVTMQVSGLSSSCPGLPLCPHAAQRATEPAPEGAREGRRAGQGHRTGTYAQAYPLTTVPLLPEPLPQL